MNGKKRKKTKMTMCENVAMPEPLATIRPFVEEEGDDDV